MDCHVCIARLRISLNPSIRKQRSACLCGCSQILLVCIVFSGGEALLLNFSIQHRKRVVASYKIPNQICLFWQCRRPSHPQCSSQPFYGQHVEFECRRTAHKHSARRAICKLQGKKFQLSRKRIGPIGDK